MRILPFLEIGFYRMLVSMCSGSGNVVLEDVIENVLRF
jgi:hypothetical protein